MQIGLTRPILLGFGVLLILVWVLYRHSLSDLPPLQRKLSMSVRLVVLILLLLAAAGMTLQREDDRQLVLFLVDRSLSVGADASGKARAFIDEAVAGMAPGDRGGKIYFAENATPLLETGRPFEEAVDTWKDRGTDITAVLEMALSHVDPSFAGRLVLLTDGWSTGGDPSATLRAAAASGVRIDCVPLSTRRDPEIQVVALEAPQHVKLGEPFIMKALVDANVEGPAQLVLYANGIKAGEKDVQIEKGLNEFVLREVPSQQRMLRYTVKVVAEQDTLVDNNSGAALVSASGKPSVLLIETTPRDAKHLKWALEKEDIAVDVRTARGVPTHLADLQNFEIIVLSNVPATDLSHSQMRMIRAYVRDLGGGLIMIGGDNAFGLGGYYKTVIEELLPVRSDFEKEKEKPSLAMVLVIDKSGSMGGMKIELAKEAAKAATELLVARDQIGVVAFDGQTRWVSEIHSAADKGYVIDRISSLQAGGGTDLGPALSASYSALEGVTAKLKHVIVLTDGISQQADFHAIASNMRDSGITVSTVAIGEGADQNLLERIAEWGNGRYYFTTDPMNIPQIFAKETVTASKSALNEQPFVAQALLPHQILSGLDMDTSPFLLGYVVTRPKPTSDLILASESGDPLLASWRYGLGKVAAFTSDAKNRWAVEWLQWPQFGQFWAQLVRDTMRKQDAGGMVVDIRNEAGYLRVVVDVPRLLGDSAVAASGDEEMMLTIVGPEMTPVEQVLEQDAPGRFQGAVDTDKEGEYHLHISRMRGDEVISQRDLGYVRGYPDELRIRPAREDLLQAWSRLGGGRFNPAPGSIFSEDRGTAWRVTPLWPLLLRAVLLLLIIDVALRRIDFSGLAQFKAWRRWNPFRVGTGAGTPTVEDAS